MIEVQRGLEQTMMDLTREAFWAEVEAAKKDGREASTPYGRQILSHAVIPCAGALTEWIEKAEGSGPGRRHRAVKFLKLIEPEVAVYLAIKIILDGISSADQFTGIAIMIGKAIEDELRLRAFQKHDPQSFNRAKEKLQRRNAMARAWMRGSMVGTSKAAGVEWEDWRKQDHLLIGKVLVDITSSTTRLWEVRKIEKGKHKTPFVISPTVSGAEWIARASERCELLSPKWWPMVCPPRPWTTPWDGGYLSKEGRLPLVKAWNRSYLEALAEGDMPEVYEAINAIQETPWKINKPVLKILDWARQTGLEVAGLPPVDDIPLPQKPLDIDTNEAAKKEWKRAATRIYSERVQSKSRRIQLHRTVGLAERFSDYPAIYFPHQMDFRGRAYAIPMFLHPQGPDHTKALLTFAKGKPIGSENGPGWLAVHGANCWGEDKVSFDDRITWVEKHDAMILRTAQDPRGDMLDWWTQADEPWQFLAFCFEWAGYREQGEDFVSCLPIAQDGSCNGIQHFSAALRDEEGGRQVNLVPSGAPQDIYQTVADRAAAFLRRDCPLEGNIEPGSGPWYAEKLLEMGLDRKITKRSVMCLPYGLTLFSARDYLEEGIRERAGLTRPFVHTKGDAENPREIDGFWEAASYLAPRVWQAIEDTVSGAVNCMAWLKKCTSLAAAGGVAITWTTPDGLLVEQRYYKTRLRRVETVLDGSTVKLGFVEELPDLDPRKMANAIAPNWVHSMDAAAMRLYVTLAAYNGVSSFAVIHDSYGTIAADVDMMNACLREAFVRMYEEHDVLEEFKNSIMGIVPEDRHHEIPQVPPKGNLDLQEVLHSDFFFS